MQGRSIPCFLTSELTYPSADVAKTNKKPADLFQATCQGNVPAISNKL
jgi:hypothetical protein